MNSDMIIRHDPAVDWHEFAAIWFAHARISGRPSSFHTLAADMATYDDKQHEWPFYLTLANAELQRCADEDNSSLMRRKRLLETYGWRFTHTVQGWTATHSAFTTIPSWRLTDLIETLPQPVMAVLA